MAVEFPMKVADILRPLGGMSHTAVLMLFGILENTMRLGIAFNFRQQERCKTYRDPKSPYRYRNPVLQGKPFWTHGYFLTSHHPIT